ncbi:hypothetical protein LCGC14_1608520 [marine sediment metagenome]|uniref:Uncharacterized protein n=1 Tax=marine sediment metagenome TaxID=412755 RepID=A0A0F9I9G2_9ZZZZ
MTIPSPHRTRHRGVWATVLPWVVRKRAAQGSWGLPQPSQGWQTWFGPRVLLSRQPPPMKG